MQALTSANLFDGDRFLDGHAVVLENHRITSVIPVSSLPSGAVVTDLGDNLIAPGFIDIQVNGGGGVLFNDQPVVATLKTISESHRAFGTTALLPTLISDDFVTMERAAEAIKRARQENVAGIIGVHFEGPYLNVARKGVHDPGKIRPFEDQAKTLYKSPGLGVVIATVAPETCPDNLIKELSDAGIRVSAGHTAATYTDIQKSLHQGLSCFTHLFNAMSPLESRAPGVVGAALEDRHAWCGIIVDGHHVHPATLKIAIAAKQKGKMILVSDAMPSVGAAVKSFTLRGEVIEARDGVCATADGTLAGSDLDMASAVRNTVRMLDQPLDEALRMASRYPAEYLGLAGRLGSIKAGYQADLVALDKDLRVQKTWIKGQMKSH